MTKAKEKPVVQSATDTDPATTRNNMVADTHTKGNVRTRNFASVVYPESAPDNWLETLADFHIEALVSPLHDKDINPTTGEIKKPHYHVMIMYSAPHTREQARALLEQIGGVGCEIVNSTRGTARYLCHLDNPEKARYNIAEVKEFSGADYQSLIQLPSDKMTAIREMIAFIEWNNIFSFSSLVRWSSEHNETWFRALCDNSAYIIKEYITSRHYCWTNAVSTSTSEWVEAGKARRIYSRAVPGEDDSQEVPF